MSLNNDDLARILAMDDGAFGALVMEIAKAAGGDENKARMLAANAPALKKTLSGMDAKEAEALLRRAGQGKGEEILKALRRNGYGR